jgi:hypothetical protein
LGQTGKHEYIHPTIKAPVNTAVNVIGLFFTTHITGAAPERRIYHRRYHFRQILFRAFSDTLRMEIRSGKEIVECAADRKEKDKRRITGSSSSDGSTAAGRVTFPS